MGFFSRLFGAKQHSAMKFPATVEVVPGQLSVNVFSHSIENVPGAFWSFVSDGLTAYGQPEIVVTLLRRKNEPEAALPEALLSFFATVHELAQRGQLVRAGEWTEFGDAGFLAPHIRGIGYAAAQPITSVEIPPDALAAVLLSSVETAIAKTCGLYRVLARLGQDARSYPFPVWCDRDRKNLVREGADNESMLNKVARIRLRGASLLSEHGRLKMLVLPSAAKDLDEAFEQLPPDVGFAFLTEPAQEADGWLVWVPGQQDPAAITPKGSAGSRLTGFHLVIAPGVDDDRVLIGEDGFFMLMRAESWQRFKAAIQGQGRFEMAASGENMSFELSWIESEYRNPVDGKIYNANEGWRDYRPHGGEDPREKIRLLTSQQEMSAAIEVDRLAKYITEISAVVATSVRPTTGPRRTIYLQFELAPGQAPQVKTASEPPGEVLESARQELMALKAPDVRGPMAFQVVVQAGALGRDRATQ